MREGLVSTIIPVFNRAEMLRDAVESVLRQRYRPIEIIIADDGSTDGTGEAGRAYARDYPETIRYVRQEKSGAGPAREAGRRLARGEFIQYLDSDDRLLPNKFEVQVKALRDHPECGAAYGFIRFCPEGEAAWEKPFKRSGEAIPELFPLLLADRWWNTDAPLFRRTVCDAVGPWTDLRYSQDWEYDSRVGALRTQLVHCPEWVCEQRQHKHSRQTGHGEWLSPPEQVRFFTLLFEHARQAGVGFEAPEMRHFVRWVFRQARECEAAGDAGAGKACLDLAIRASGENPSRDLLWYRRITGVAGGRAAGRIFRLWERLMPRRAGAATLKQSWMESAQ